ncbi:MAG: AmmeMemoRadiSam system protein B [Chloroflexi bacterium]|nr:AmmeMemoRadiSam system protein B [Chloroflexota bacterium]MCL5274366.1 AmmeMemoRadiSam system protein B [Chloroflexota bacterium]
MSIPDYTRSPAVRAAHYAGSWYPGNAEVLRRSIEGYLARVHPATLPGPALALVSPHPGHQFGGLVAAQAFTQIRGQPVKRVVLMGPLHRPIRGSALGEFMVPRERSYATPLGQIPLDVDFITALSQRAPLTFVQGDQEHSLEIELPFLQVAVPSFALVPIMMGADIADRDTPAALEVLAGALVELADPDTLFVASTDLSHLDDYRKVVQVDHRMIELVEAFDIPALVKSLAWGEVYACGATGLVTALRAAQLRGATGARVLSYMNSGDVTGDRTPGAYTVGYMAVAAY